MAAVQGLGSKGTIFEECPKYLPEDEEKLAEVLGSLFLVSVGHMIINQPLERRMRFPLDS